MSKGLITTAIKCDVCGGAWFGCSDTRVNIVKARKRVQHENGFTTSRIGSKLIDVCGNCVESNRQRPTVANVFSPRETQVLAYIAEGYNTTKIAEFMGLSLSTISTYTSMLYAKTGTLNREELFKFARMHEMLKETRRDG